MFATGINQLRAATQGLRHGTITTRDKVPLVLALILFYVVVAPLDVFQLVCALCGAILYAVIYLPTGPNPKGQRPKGKASNFKIETDNGITYTGTAPRKAGNKPVPSKLLEGPSPQPKAAFLPIKAPTFAASDFDAQVDEFIGRISPTPSCHRAVEDLTAVVRYKVKTLIPEAEVTGFATGNLQGGTAYGVAVPEVDIVVNVSPTDLMNALQGRLQQLANTKRLQNGSRPGQRDLVARLDARKLQKSAIRVCTSLLVSAGFKFRRSSFRSEDPKVTLLAPPALGASKVGIPVDFSINNSTPLYNMALLTECGQMDSRARSLILLVKRWAKDRGICHASKGHLPPYAWSLLAIYFLQAGIDEEDGGLPLPALDEFAVSSGLISGEGQPSSKAKGSSARPAAKDHKKTLAELFRVFVRFYKWEFNWRNEAVSVRSGKRAPPNLSLDIHIVLNDDGTTAVSPTIEDPFDARTNLGCCTTAMSLQRLTEELDRADNLLTKGTTLTQLLEPWRPPELEEKPEVADSGGEDQ